MPFKRVKPALGTFFEITLKNVSRERAIKLTEDSFVEVYRLEKIFNIFDPESEISKINTSPINFAQYLSPELNSVLQFGSEIELLSNGAFKLMPDCQHLSCHDLSSNSVTRLSQCQFDLGGLAKGYIIDRVYENLHLAAPEASVFVNAGGDLRCHGPEDIKLKVATLDEEKHFAIKNFYGALATSSLLGANLKVGKAANRYGRIFDFFENQPATVTVGARTCMVADAFTKVLLFNKGAMVNGEKYSLLCSLSFNKQGRCL